MECSVQFSHLVVSDSVTPRTTACQASLSITNSRSLLKVMSSNWWCHPTISSSVVPFSSCLQSSPASGSFLRSQFFTYWSFSFSISPSNEYSGLISFRMDWLDLLCVSPGYFVRAALANQYKWSSLQCVYITTKCLTHGIAELLRFSFILLLIQEGLWEGNVWTKT